MAACTIFSKKVDYPMVVERLSSALTGWTLTIDGERAHWDAVRFSRGSETLTLTSLVYREGGDAFSKKKLGAINWARTKKDVSDAEKKHAVDFADEIEWMLGAVYSGEAFEDAPGLLAALRGVVHDLGGALFDGRRMAFA